MGGHTIQSIALKLYLLSYYPCHLDLGSPIFLHVKTPFLISKYFMTLQLDDGWVIIVVLFVPIDRKKNPEKRTANLVIHAFK